ncbi:MAG TPA: V-type ATP synthase subunit E family protein [Gaiellaceae bacterium]|nr:V-type ATP synthase subunit E family protein [Gaiellaceae bacterium]
MNLGPVREALLAEARADAARLLADADERAEATLAAADAEAEALVRAAREEGAAAADIDGAYDRAQAHRVARRLVLEARRELHDELRRTARARVEALREAPEYEALLARLAAAARRQLGEAAQIELDPGGGLRASSGGRSVDYTLDAVVTRALDALGTRTEALWS